MSSLSALPASTLTNATPSSPLTVGGLISGLNTNQIIQGLLAIDQQRINDAKQKETQVQQEQTAFQGIEAHLLTLQGDITNLGKSQNGTFDGRTVTSSNTSAVTAAASASAAPGVYSLQVNGLATAQQVASQGFDSATAAITQGTLQLKTADGTVTTITIDGSNDTLQGLADAINNSGAAVSAAVVNDGTGAQPFRLLLTANNTGTAGAVTITNNLGASGGGAVQPVFNQSYVGAAVLGAGFTGTSAVTSNAGPGNYTGTANDTYTFTVLSGGTVGTDGNIQIGYRDSTGANTGTLTLAAGDVNTAKTVANGITVQFGAGTLVAGQTFTVKATVPTVQTATDASVTLGSGAGALTVTSGTNQIDNLIPGVTLKLAATTGGQPVTITVANDVAGAQKAIDSFVSDYNALMQFIDQQLSFDPTSAQAGVLLGDTRANDIQDQVRAIVGNVVPGANPQLNQLAAIGITTDDNGRLVVDDSKLSSVLSGGVPGVGVNDVKRLFALTGSSNSAGVEFITGGTSTRASNTPYTVQISQAATQASVTASSALASSVTIDNTNNILTLTVGGRTASVTLAAGTYTPAALAQMVQGAINGDSDLAGRQVTAALQNGALTLTSSTYGSSSQVALGGGSANAALGFSGTETAHGQDVVGSFVVNGVTEAARGSGQFLIGNSGNANTDGLEVRVTLTPAQVGGGTQAQVNVSRGLASQLDVVLNGMLDPVNGRLKTIDDSFNQTTTDLNNEITADTSAMQAKQQSLLNEFTAMEQTLAQLQAASNFISAQTQAALASATTQTQKSSTTTG